MSKTILFISSVQKELAEERHVVRDFVRGDPLLRRFFDVFLFEDIPASDRRADDVYLQQVDRCGIYIGIYGLEYGAEDADGFSPTEREFDQASAKGKPRLIFVKGADDKGRHPKMIALIRKVGAQLIRRRFAGVPDLTAAVYASLVEHMERLCMIQTRPFEQQACPRAGLADINDKAVAGFVRRARNERRFPLAESTSAVDVLTHLHLLEDGRVSNAAILLFGRDPQRFMACSEVRCMHFHGTEIQRPVPFYQIFKGNLFEQVDQAVDFVLSKVNRSVGTRAEGPRAPVRYELPEDVVAEAIVNAVVHRDYTSSGAIQVSVFADRVEVWNPGELLPPLTAESLRKPHRSILRNTRIAEALYLAHYIEKYGTGTLMMIRESVEYALPEPRFGTEEPGEFGVTVWRDWLTEEVMAKLDINERQRRAIAYLKTHESITNAAFQELSGAPQRTSVRDLMGLVRMGVLEHAGLGRGTCYVLRRNRAINVPIVPRASAEETRHKPVKPEATKGAKVSQRAQWAHRGGRGKRGSPEPSRDQVEAHDKAHDEGQTRGKADSKPTRSATQSPSQSSDPVTRLLIAMRGGALSPQALCQAVGLKHRQTFRMNYLRPALKAGFIEPTIPTRPTSRFQKYRLTAKGCDWLVKEKS